MYCYPAICNMTTGQLQQLIRVERRAYKIMNSMCSTSLSEFGDQTCRRLARNVISNHLHPSAACVPTFSRHIPFDDREHWWLLFHELSGSEKAFYVIYASNRLLPLWTHINSILHYKIIWFDLIFDLIELKFAENASMVNGMPPQCFGYGWSTGSFSLCTYDMQMW